MFLDRRATEEEYFDQPSRSLGEVAAGFRELARINRMFRFAEPFQRLIPRALGTDRCRRLSLLDLGAGDGSLGATLAKWASGRGWEWTVTNLDMSLPSLSLSGNPRSVAASVTALPFPDRSFDVVIASQMTHHLPTEDAVVRHFREAWRVAREFVFLNDLHRNLALYSVIACVLKLGGFSSEFRSDGLLSVRRGWRVGEWEELSRRAGIPEARISLYYGARILFQARRGARPSPSPHQ
jgi:2-polyprenyl-3-methyl-5-hydroxy-6-metoxy-1,4-benzoquinol methylase